jgi:hypothetical protein
MGELIEEVNSFNCLGYMITVTNHRDLEIKVPTLSYGSEIWNIRKRKLW